VSAALRVLAVVVAAGAGVGLGVVVYRTEPWRKLGHSAPAADASSGASSAPSAPPRPSSPSLGAASASAGPVASAAAVAAPKVEDPVACVKRLFAEGTFPDDASELAVVCDEPDAIAIAKRMTEIVVKAGAGHVTDGMKEWSVLGFHKIAAVATLRGRCCPSAPALQIAAAPGSCDPLGDVLADVSAASRAGVSDDEIEAAASRFDKDARCIVRSGQTGRFGGYEKIDGGETTAFEKFMRRAQGATPTP
jgi:hypothetical protein